MKLIKFVAKNVHDYLDFHIVFQDHINFIAGLNGSGKTTALKLIMALLTPNYTYLKETEFSEISLELKLDKQAYTLLCRKENNKIVELKMLEKEIRSSNSSKREQVNKNLKSTSKTTLHDLKINIELLKKMMDSWQDESLFSEYKKNISILPTPIFLPIDRRSFHDSDEQHAIKYNNSLEEAQKIIFKAASKAKEQQLHEEMSLRNNILKNALSFNTQFKLSDILMPTTSNISTLTEKLHSLEIELNKLEINGKEFLKQHKSFLVKMAKSTVAENKKDILSVFHENKTEQKLMLEWFQNYGQIQKIDKLFDVVSEHQKKISDIYQDLNTFSEMLNMFFEETKKTIGINSMNILEVKIDNKVKNISILSSGEIQILVILTHLILNEDLSQHEIFIVDEPEISLHISWQDQFVNAIETANPKLQVILATHSPAIIGGRTNMYVPLNSTRGKK